MVTMTIRLVIFITFYYDCSYHPISCKDSEPCRPRPRNLKWVAVLTVPPVPARPNEALGFDSGLPTTLPARIQGSGFSCRGPLLVGRGGGRVVAAAVAAGSNRNQSS